MISQTLGLYHRVSMIINSLQGVGFSRQGDYRIVNRKNVSETLTLLYYRVSLIINSLQGCLE